LEFEKFENKSDAIGTSGIDDPITRMIKDWYSSGETILVGKNEHKLAIETELVSLSTLFLASTCATYINAFKICCVFDRK
jgi:hypothetical protein